MPKRNEADPRLIDARGLKCPWPVLRAARAMRECSAIDLLADDPVALVDVPVLAAAHGWSVTISECEKCSRFLLKKPEAEPAC